jgi:vitamin B12 transporter
MYSSHSFAQSAASTEKDTTRLDEVVVTAAKFPMKTAATGKVLIIITAKDLERSGSRDLAQVLTAQGGIYINGANSTPGKDKSIYIRGGRAEHTLITIDGVPVYDASGIGSNFDIRNIAIETVERIEILKGSQGTLYGSDAIAGVVNIITKGSGTKPLSAYGSASTGSLSSFRGSAGISGRKGKADYSAGYTFFNTAGISEAEQHPDSTLPFDKDGYRQESFVASFGFTPTAAWKIKPYLRYTHNKGGYDAQGYVDAPNRYVSKNTQAGLRNEVGFGPAKLTLSYNFTQTDRDYHTASDETFYKGNEHFAEGYFVYPTGALTFTSGLDVRHSNTALHSTSPFVAAINKDSALQTQFAVFTALNYAGNGGWNMELGGRYNHHSEYGGNFAFNINPSYGFSTNWKVFANLSSGYKTPGLYQLFSEYGNRRLAPETSINLEGGIRYESNDKKLSIRGVYFDRKVKDAIAFFFDPVTFASKYINQDEQNDHGFELDARYAANDKWDLKAFYSYADGTIRTRSGGKDTTFFNLYRRPLSTFTIQVGTRLQPKLYVSTNLQAVWNTRDITFDPPLFTQREVKLQDHFLLNLYGEYALLQNRVKVFIDAANVTNERYATIYGYNSLGRTVYGGVRFSF